MDLIVDVQFCRDVNEKLIPKEVAILSLKENFLAHWIVSPPHSIKKLNNTVRKQNHWLLRNKHGFSWLDAGISQKNLRKSIRNISEHADKIFVRGKDKKVFIQEIVTNNVINLEENDTCPSLANLTWVNTYCIHHSVKFCYLTYACALNNTAKLKLWLTNREETLPEIFGNAENEQSGNITTTCPPAESHNWGISERQNSKEMDDTFGFSV